MTEKKYDIFISYARKDFNEVYPIVEMLKARIPTLNCWFDITGIESGDEFEDKIITAIDSSQYVLFALSDNAIQSIYAKKEVMYAQATHTKIIPLLLKNAQLKGWFLFNFGRIDCIDSTNSLQMEKLIKNLADWMKKELTDTPTTISHSSSSNIHTFYYKDGKEKYEGEIKNGVYNGQGTYYYENGDKYEGQYIDGQRNGQGTFYYANGNKYEGQFKDDKRNGQCTYYYANGDKYEGQFKDGKRNGQGTYYYANGDKYVGQYENDKRNGQGTFYYTNGDTYEGQYKDGKRDGQGTYYYANGNKYEGQYKDGKRNGQGAFYYANGDKYEGQYKDGKRNGQGTFYNANGNKYEGQFENDIMHGIGTLFHSDGKIEKVIFNKGVLQIKETSKKAPKKFWEFWK